jgi:Cys-tRNA(Pro)/Cys-tRNA(Cys) deacylase
MTPAVKALDDLGFPYRLLEYDRDATGDRDIGLAAAAALSLPEEQVFKTLIAELAGGELVVAIIPVAAKLDLKQLARTCGVKSAALAETKAAERATGYLTGGISPLGQKRRHRTFLAEQASAQDQIYVSAGRRGLELALSPGVLIEATKARICALVA